MQSKYFAFVFDFLSFLMEKNGVTAGFVSKKNQYMMQRIIFPNCLTTPERALL